MNLDDESLLSAYLDDELDPARRLGVEAALLDDPQLSERLQQLALVRSAMARMPRPVADADLAGPILRRVESLPSVRLRRALEAPSTRRRLRLGGSALGSLAAVLLVAVVLGIPTIDEPRRGDAPNEGRPRGSDLTSTTPDLPVTPRGDARGIAARTELADDDTAPPSPNSPRFAATPEALDAAADREIVRDYLEREDVRRILLVVDQIDERSLAEVRGVIQETGRENPVLGEIRIAQGIEIDPRRPHEAVVFLVVLEDREYEHLRDNLRRHTMDAVVDDRALEPSIVTQLADVGSIELTPGQPVPALRGQPPEHLGPLHLALPKAPGEATADRLANVAPGEPGTGPDRSPSGPTARDGEAGSDGPATPPEGHGVAAKVYLVWVTTRGDFADPRPL